MSSRVAASRTHTTTLRCSHAGGSGGGGGAAVSTASAGSRGSAEESSGM